MEGRMMMRRKQESIHRAVTVTQAVSSVNGKSAQLCRACMPTRLGDLPHAFA
jgi:hypothetical protein